MNGKTDSKMKNTIFSFKQNEKSISYFRTGVRKSAKIQSQVMLSSWEWDWIWLSITAIVIWHIVDPRENIHTHRAFVSPLRLLMTRSALIRLSSGQTNYLNNKWIFLLYYCVVSSPEERNPLESDPNNPFGLTFRSDRVRQLYITFNYG